MKPAFCNGEASHAITSDMLVINAGDVASSSRKLASAVHPTLAALHCIVGGSRVIVRKRADANSLFSEGSLAIDVCPHIVLPRFARRSELKTEATRDPVQRREVVIVQVT